MASAPGFEPLPSARYSVETIDGAPWIVVRAARNWFVLPFIAVWLTFWTFGGMAAMHQAASDPSSRPFLAVWLVGWAVGWVFAASIVGWQIAGRSQVSVQAGALVTRWQMPFVGRTKHYDAGQVRHLRATSLPWPFAGFGRMSRAAYPPWFGNPGSVQFDYGARTVRVLPGLDEAEGRMVAEWLGKRLPVGAVG
jgi:hypothetical protein